MYMCVHIYIYVYTYMDLGGQSGDAALLGRVVRGLRRLQPRHLRPGCRVQGAGFRVQGAECRAQSAGCRVQGAGFRVLGSGCRVEGHLSLEALLGRGRARLDPRHIRCQH